MAGAVIPDWATARQRNITRK